MDGLYIYGVHATPIVVASISGIPSNEVVDCQFLNDILPGMTNAQRQQFIDLIGNSSSNCPHGRTPFPWLIDSGASHHVTSILDLLSNVHHVSDYPIGLPDGTKLVSTMQGDVALCSDIILHNVFYVPKLQCNLISVTQLIDDQSCTVHFTKIICVIQDLHLSTLIGVGERRNGLYYFRGFPRISAVNTDGASSTDLWHQCLGHPSDKVMRSFPFFVKSSSKISIKPYGICHQAKQSRDKFPVS